MVEHKIILSIPSAVTCLKKPRKSTSVPVDPSTWYLGGNHTIKLLFSVDGDLDPKTLDLVSSVPTVVGELALSVESLVSHDITVGGFENDVLAKITSNTLVAKHQATE